MDITILELDRIRYFVDISAILLVVSAVIFLGLVYVVVICIEGHRKDLKSLFFLKSIIVAVTFLLVVLGIFAYKGVGFNYYSQQIPLEEDVVAYPPKELTSEEFIYRIRREK